MKRFGPILFFIAYTILFFGFVAIGHAQTATPTPWWTPIPTWTAAPTWTPIPTWTNTPVQPTWTPPPARTAPVQATATPYPLPTSPATPYIVPNAVGAGKAITGGRAGSIYTVTNCGDSLTPTPGTFRYAMQEVNTARMIRFAPGCNNINLVKMIEVGAGDSNVTVFGQSAPGGVALHCRNVAKAGADWGNCIRSYNGFQNFSLQGMKLRSGVLANATPSTDQQEGHAMSLDAPNIYLWHNSFTHGQDENLTLFDSQNSTVDSNIISGSTTYDHFSACAISLVSTGTAPDDMTPGITFYRNIMNYCMDRTPEIKIKSAEMIQNLIQYTNSMRQATTIRGGTELDLIGNWWKGNSFLNWYVRAQGPGTNTLDTGATGDPSVRALNNQTPFMRYTAPESEQRKMVRWTTENVGGSSRPLPTPVSNPRALHGWTHPAYYAVPIPTIEPTILAGVGASWYVNEAGDRTSARDDLDTAIIDGWKRNKAIIPFNDKQPAAIPTVAAGPTPRDTDNDAVGDSFESENGMTIGVNDALGDVDGDGWKNFEEYMHGLHHGNGSFSPVNLGDKVVFWLSSKDATRQTISGTGVSQIDPKGGSKVRWVQGTDANRPSYTEHQAIVATRANNDHLTMSNDSVLTAAVSSSHTQRPHSVYVVFNTSTNNQTQSLWNFTTGTSHLSGPLLSSAGGISYHNVSNFIADNGLNYAINQKNLFSATFNGINTIVDRLNGGASEQTKAGGPVTNISQAVLFGRTATLDNYNGSLWEAIVVNDTTDLATVQKIEGYLAWKHGITANLPAGHPYKSVRP